MQNRLKDIFVDNNVAKNFASAQDSHYSKFRKWLYYHGSLVVSKKLIQEYMSSNRDCAKLMGIVNIIDVQTRDGRLNNISNQRLRAFRFPENIKRRFRAEHKDYDFIKLVLLSYRKLALTIDGNLKYDILHYPGYSCIASSRPERIPYN